MTEPLLKVNQLTTAIGRGSDKENVVDNVSFEINKGETFVLLVSQAVVNQLQRYPLCVYYLQRQT